MGTQLLKFHSSLNLLYLSGTGISNLIQILITWFYTTNQSMVKESAVVSFEISFKSEKHLIIYHPVYEKINWPGDLHRERVPIFDWFQFDHL